MGVAIIAVYLGASVLLMLVGHWVFRAARQSVGPAELPFVNALAVFVALSPFTFVQIAFDFGRYDLFSILMFCAALALVHRRRLWLASAVALIAILLHEAFLIWAAPVLLAFMLAVANDRPAVGLSDLVSASRRRPSLAATGALALAMLALTVVLLQAGLNTEVRDIPHGGGHQTWLPGSIGVHRDDHGLFMYAMMGLLIAAILHLLATEASRSRWSTNLVLVAPLSGTALFFLANDYGRWLNFIAIAFTAAALIHVVEARAKAPRMNRAADLLVLLPVVFIVLGPVGIVRALPYVRTALRVLGLSPDGA